MKLPAAAVAIRPWDGTEPDLDRYLDERAAADKRVMEEYLIMDYGWSAAAAMATEAMSPWRYATAGRWYYRALLRGEAS